MPLVIDENLDPSLFPLAWLIGKWEGHGAVQLPQNDEAELSFPIPAEQLKGHRVEQELTVESVAGKPELRWVMNTWVLDAPAPAPPTSAFYENAGEGAEAASNSTADGSQPVRELLLQEIGTWRTTGVLPGQDVAKAQAAKRGTAESFLSHGVTLTMQRTTGFGKTDAEHWAGEVRGPRIQLASQDLQNPFTQQGKVTAIRMFGMVGGGLMWLQEIGSSLSTLQPYLSIELQRAPEMSQEEAEAAAQAAKAAKAERESNPDTGTTP